jgi:HK97 family phage major capsid protein/HK97 family phage prohead protease
MTTTRRPAAPTALPVQYRTLTIERDVQRAANDDRIPISISSEEPVDRWFGEEILGHSAGECDLTRAKANGLALLLDHSTREQVGRVEDIALGKDKKLRGLMRFGRSAKAQEIRQDVEDGIRSDISVGYRINELKLVSSSDDKDTYRATRWMPMEVSLVSVPADITVGVGRDADRTEYPVTITQPAPQARSEPVDPIPTAAPGAAPAAVAAPTRDHRTEVLDIENMIRAANHGRSEPLVSDDERRGFIERGMSPDQVAKAIFGKMGATIREIPTTPQPVLDMPNSERREFSIGRAVKAMVDKNFKDAGFERAVSEALQKRLGLSSEGILMPMDALLSRTSLATSGSTTGQKTVYTEPGSFIEYLANTAVVPSLGPLRLTGLQGNVAMPRKSAKGSAAWYAELFGGSDATESNMTFDQVSLSPKTIASTESYSKQLFQQSVLAIDTIMRADIFENIALLFDAACFHGSGASNQISGLYTISGLNSVAMGGAITYPKLVDMESANEADNAALATIAYVTTPEVKGAGKKTVMFTTSGSGTIWTGGLRGEMNGYTAVASNQLSKVLGTGTNEHGIIFGSWSQAIVADWGAIDLTVDPYTKARQNVVNVTGVALMDFNVRHPEAFCKGTGLTAA